MANSFKARWLCGLCNAPHDFEFKAQQCCMPDTIAVFVCELCETIYGSKTEAAACCTKSDRRRESDALFRAQLEQRGQTRLVE